MIHRTLVDLDRETFYIEIKPVRLTPDIQKWLTDTDGAGYSLGGWGIYFYKEEDATMFALKWL